MEGRGGDLEENADEHQRQGRDQEETVRDGGQAGDLVDLRGAGGAEDQGDAVEKECRGEGAEQEVLDGGFRAAAGLLAVAGQNVSGDGGDFERDEDEQQLDGPGEQAHADCAEDDESIEFALVVAVCRERIERDEQRDEDDAADEHMEEDGEGAGLDGAVEAGSRGKRELPEAGPEGERGADGGDPAQRAARGGGGQRRPGA